jgi:pSer/pThr/pTyr-binding forkhead associated (FHA) protein
MAIRLEPLDEGPLIPLDRPIVFVGRHADCDVRIESKKISRRHCAIVQLHDKLVIRDLGSTNGVYFNGQRVDEAVIAVQDELQIANLRYQVVKGEPTPVVAAAPQVKGALHLEHDEEQGAVGRNGADRKPTQEIPNE